MKLYEEDNSMVGPGPDSLLWHGVRGCIDTIQRRVWVEKVLL